MSRRWSRRWGSELRCSRRVLGCVGVVGLAWVAEGCRTPPSRVPAEPVTSYSHTGTPAAKDAEQSELAEQSKVELPEPFVSTVKTVTISLAPYSAEPSCGDTSWLGRPMMQNRMARLNRKLEPFGRSMIGIAFDDMGKRVVVVFDPAFSRYAEVQAALADAVAPLQVSLRPGVHSLAEIAEAEKVLDAMDWHPRAKSIDLAWAAEPARSGFRVVIDERAPEVARALQRRLGSLVNVTLGRPVRWARKRRKR